MKRLGSLARCFATCAKNEKPAFWLMGMTTSAPSAGTFVKANGRHDENPVLKFAIKLSCPIEFSSAARSRRGEHKQEVGARKTPTGAKNHRFNASAVVLLRLNTPNSGLWYEETGGDGEGEILSV